MWIERLPGVLEQALLGEGILGVKNDQLRFRFFGLEIVGDQACPFVWPGRTAEGIGGRRHHHRAAVIHRFELTAQQQGLLAGPPGVRHALGGGLRVAGQTVPADIDAGREYQAVVGKLRAICEGHDASLWVDRCAGRELENHLITGELVVTEFLRLDLAKPGDDAIAEWAGDKCTVRFDQRHGDARIEALDETGASDSAKSTPTTTTRPAAPCARAGSGSSVAPAAAALRKSRRLVRVAVMIGLLPQFFCAPYQAAMALTSSSEKPLAMRSITVAGRCRDLNACMAATMSAGLRPVSGATVASAVRAGAWQPEQERAPGGASARPAAEA